MNRESDLPDALQAKRDRLLQLLRGYGSCAVGFSGGLDSSVLARAAVEALGEKAVAVTVAGASIATGELDEARDVARHIGIRHEIVTVDEISQPEYRRNDSDRCYHCKKVFGQTIADAAERLGLAVVVDGRNRDDLGDYRPGIRAAVEMGIQGPLAECGLTKAELRQLAQQWRLPTWDKPATPCLSSRIAYGEEITPERLAMIDRAEQSLRALGFRPLRVRYHGGDLARVEVPESELPRFANAELRRQVVASLKDAGFKYVSLDLEGFRSGSMNESLSAETLLNAGQEP
ncbi:MAG: ATP-dependent sacrificial sulfur transferase LarE [Patescibacteria group bacterium]|nr:ATP-dependent sacrificial sulfur transferase LarE [Patescibacteria group bacterium]